MILKGRSASIGRTQGIAQYYRKTGNTTGSIILVDGPLTAEIGLNLRFAKGVAASMGGITSHGANILREFNIPCLVAIEGLRQIKEGSCVILDCFRGTIEVKDEI